MRLMDRILGRTPSPKGDNGTVAPVVNAAQTLDDSQALVDYIEANKSLKPLQVTAVLRCIDLLSSSLAMLPIRVVDTRTRAQLDDHPLMNLLQFEPNGYQTAIEFKRLMERRRMTDNDGSFAYIVKSGGVPIALHPMERSRVTIIQHDDWRVTYEITRKNGTKFAVPADCMLHLRDIPDCPITGQSRTNLAKQAIEISSAAANAQRNIFKNGVISGDTLETDNQLSDQAFARLKADMKAKAGTDRAGEIMILEEGLKRKGTAMTAVQAQTAEARAHQIEEMGRVFGVPRPLLMMDDTSWGSGIEQLGTLFVRFGLAPSLVSWEQALRRVLLTPREKKTLDIDIDERLLLRGSLKDQAEYFAKASGSGGHKPWLLADEIRHQSGEPPLTPEQRLLMETPNVQAKPV